MTHHQEPKTVELSKVKELQAEVQLLRNEIAILRNHCVTNNLPLPQYQGGQPELGVEDTVTETENESDVQSSSQDEQEDDLSTVSKNDGAGPEKPKKSASSKKSAVKLTDIWEKAIRLAQNPSSWNSVKQEKVTQKKVKQKKGEQTEDKQTKCYQELSTTIKAALCPKLAIDKIKRIDWSNFDDAFDGYFGYDKVATESSRFSKVRKVIILGTIRMRYGLVETEESRRAFEKAKERLGISLDSTIKLMADFAAWLLCLVCLMESKPSLRGLSTWFVIKLLDLVRLSKITKMPSEVREQIQKILSDIKERPPKLLIVISIVVVIQTTFWESPDSNNPPKWIPSESCLQVSWHHYDTEHKQRFPPSVLGKRKGYEPTLDDWEESRSCLSIESDETQEEVEGIMRHHECQSTAVVEQLQKSHSLEQVSNTMDVLDKGSHLQSQSQLRPVEDPHGHAFVRGANSHGLLPHPFDDVFDDGNYDDVGNVDDLFDDGNYDDVGNVDDLFNDGNYDDVGNVDDLFDDGNYDDVGNVDDLFDVGNFDDVGSVEGLFQMPPLCPPNLPAYNFPLQRQSDLRTTYRQPLTRQSYPSCGLGPTFAHNIQLS